MRKGTDTGILQRNPPLSSFLVFQCARGLLCCFLSALMLLPMAGCTFFFFNPGKELIVDPETAKYTPEEVNFKSGDGTSLTGWYFKAKGEPLGSILVCHGNVENMSTHAKLDLWLIEAGYNIFIFDYRGYGRSEGIPDVKGVNLDAEAALETLLSRTKGKIVVFGKSLGGAIAVYTVARSSLRDRVKGLIIEGAFSSYRGIAREKIAGSIIGWPFQYPLSFLVNDEYSPVDCIGRISPIPVLIMHGYADPVVSPDHARILYDAAEQPKEYWELNVPGHVKSWTDQAIRSRLLSHLARLR